MTAIGATLSPGWRAKTAQALGHAGRRALARLRSRAVRESIADHWMTVIGLSCADAAFFTHSVFSGLLVTAASWILLELKVSRG